MQLSLLLKHCKFLYKTCFYTKFQNASYRKYWFAGLFRVFANWVTFGLAVASIFNS